MTYSPEYATKIDGETYHAMYDFSDGMISVKNEVMDSLAPDVTEAKAKAAGPDGRVEVPSLDGRLSQLIDSTARQAIVNLTPELAAEMTDEELLNAEAYAEEHAGSGGYVVTVWIGEDNLDGSGHLGAMATVNLVITAELLKRHKPDHRLGKFTLVEDREEALKWAAAAMRQAASETQAAKAAE